MLQAGSTFRSDRAVPLDNGLITERIRGEFREMPGLVLTVEQACRLWCLDEPTCITVLAQLVDAGFLCQKGDRAYGRSSDLMIRPRMAKATLEAVDRSRRVAAD